jgi:hypothetical protein
VTSRSGIPLAPFHSWTEVVAHARSGGKMFYQAPMDYHPSLVTVRAGTRKIRVWPPGSHGRGRARTSDPFMADKGHLDRFLRPV